MASHARFKNENGNAIFIMVDIVGDEVHIIGVGPNSTVYHEWTKREARELMALLMIELGSPDGT